jgi:O-antigen ligase
MFGPRLMRAPWLLRLATSINLLNDWRRALLVPQRRSETSSGRTSGSPPPESLGERLATAMPAIFAALCLLFGGSSRLGLPSNALLEVISVVVLLWLAISGALVNPFKQAPGVAWLLSAILGVLLLHIVPLPPSIWMMFPGRSFVVEGYQMLGLANPALPLSLDPGRTRAALLSWLPAGCMLSLVLRTDTRCYLPLALTIVAIGLLSLLVGIAQAIGGPESALYFYASASREGAKGFFANSNHLATLFLACVPLLAASVVELRRTRGSMSAGPRAASILALICLALGVFIAGSVAGVLLLIPVLGASALVLRPRGHSGRWPFVLALLAIVGASAGIVALSSRAPNLTTSFASGDLDRIGIARSGWQLAKDYWPTGSGIGSFQAVYQVRESPETITNIYVNHAHNEYLEILIEAGLPGVLLLLALAVWGARRTYIAWRSSEGDAHWKLASSIVLGVVAAHGLIDYPARTLAILTISAACSVVLGRNRIAAPTSTLLRVKR